MKQERRKELRQEGRLDLLWQYLKFTIIEDPELEGASPHAVRQHFKQWVGERSVERDVPYADSPHIKDLPRFQYCLAADQKSLETMAAYDFWLAAGGILMDKVNPGISSFIVCTLIDLNVGRNGRGATGYPAVKGCTRAYTGWMFMSLNSIVYIYESRCNNGLVECGWDEVYLRPPLVYPSEIPIT